METSQEPPLRQTVRERVRRRAAWIILGMLLTSMLFSPLADINRLAGILVNTITILSILFGASIMTLSRRVVWVGVVAAAFWLLARLLEEFDSGRHAYDHMAHVAGLFLSCILIWAMFSRIRDPGQVTSGVLVESAIVYLILAIAFSQLYWILNELTLRAFNQPIGTRDSATLLYFSIVTLTAMGASVILPEHPFVRMVAGFESMVGVFYIAVIVSRLVALYHARARSDQGGDDARP